MHDQQLTEPNPKPDDVYPRTHIQASNKIHQYWKARQYATAAHYAALAHTLAVDAGDLNLAAKYAQARQLAHKYQALKVEMEKIQWNVAVDPILQPDDPPSSEARCNMVCKPDRPQQLHLDDHQQPLIQQILPTDPTLNESYPVNHSPVLAFEQPCANGDMDIDQTLCCLPITCAPWKRKR